MKSLLFTLLLVFSVGAGIATYSDEELEVKADQTFVFINAKGNVTFNHSAHQKAFDCASCHPPLAQKFDDSASIKEIAHSHCKECHKANNGPTACNECHVK